MHVLILGGTGEARALASRLVAAGHDVTTSLAGRTETPLQPQGALRVGGFGGTSGLAAYLRTTQTNLLIDATHPYAGRISANAVAASAESGVPLIRLLRAQWNEPAGARWQRATDPEAAAAALPTGAVVLLTTGHGGLDAFLMRTDCRFLVRVIEAPAKTLPAHMRLLIDRPPYDLAGETALLRREGITHLVSKNSGGGQTSAKLDAAQALGITVVMIDRPLYAPAREVADIEATMLAVHELASRR